MPTRAAVEAAKQLVRVRLGDDYDYGGMFSPTNLRQGTDCSGVWNDVLGMVVGRFQWGREAEGATTENYRPKTMGGPIPIGGRGPFGTIVVASPRDIPADACVKLAFHHGPGGGAASHMWGELDGMRIESGGSKGLVTQPLAWEITNSYANAWAYLPGPIVDDGTPITEPVEVVWLGRNYESTGDRVRQLQTALNGAGAKLDVDGEFGPQTEAAVLTFQRARGLLADGIAGPQTLAALGLSFGGGTRPDTSAPEGHGLTVAVLAQIMDHRVADTRYEALLPKLILALHLIDATTPKRRAMAFAQLGHESGGLKYQREIASGAAYEGRCSDLGNCQPGDGVRYAGRDFLQVTGRGNYTRLSQWAFERGLVPSPTFFVDEPGALETDQYAFLGFVWYWVTRRFAGKTLNELADAGDIESVSRAVNGTNPNTGRANGIEDRIAFYQRALAAGDDLLDPETLDPWEALIMSVAPRQTLSHFRADNVANLAAIDALYQNNAMLHENMVLDAVERGEVWAVQELAKLAGGNTPGAHDPDGPFWVARATQLLNAIQATRPDLIAAATPGKA